MELFDHAPYTSAERDEAEHIRSWVNVSRELLNARIALGYSQESVARIAKTNQARVSEIEAMSANPRLDTLDRVARAVGLMVTLVPRSSTFRLIGTKEYLVPFPLVGRSEPIAVGAFPNDNVANNNFALAT
jgi:transcriptional regulator with XRE-family HTH domain